jgi:hypothetical protein
MDTLKCPCGKTTEYDNPSRGACNVGHCQDATGWSALFTSDGGVNWICPACAQSAVIFAKYLRGLLGTDQASLFSILKFKV